MSNENKPVHRLRLSTIAAAVFRNVSEDGHVSYNATFDRSYKDGNEWKRSHNYGRDDLLNLSKLADQANTWIHEQQQAEAQRPKPEPGTS
ncbi:hypothetical protein K227x_58760 [Rubripirellula lacrimiformis]|uniref:Uncharacterized protein n=1 Tax=Rubripirellula lacrimiformis TaxID=1930273 RepID=A0A517NJZ6_9BACT|nr:hypothetical protein [Rubripirellula lacrimiformis]QDT07449.1 hypothetical protein K227x_58760 [Rubripirellula lacrimiformis]